MTDPRMARADLTAGVVFLVLAVAVISGSWTMDRLEFRQIHPLSAPGFTPGLLGIALAFASLLLIAQAIRNLRTAPAQEATATDGAENPGAVRRLFAATGLCLLYALGLVGRMPFWLATAIFVTVFIGVFEWTRTAPPARHLRRLGWAVFLGLATGFAVDYVFRVLFLVRLP